MLLGTRMVLKGDEGRFLRELEKGTKGRDALE